MSLKPLSAAPNTFPTLRSVVSICCSGGGGGSVGRIQGVTVLKYIALVYNILRKN